jgi:hypothetical protein
MNCFGEWLMQDKLSREEFNAKTKNYILKFVSETDPATDTISTSILTIMSQFIETMKHLAREHVAKHGGAIDLCGLIETEIKALRLCIIDLEKGKELISRKETMQ